MKISTAKTRKLLSAILCVAAALLSISCKSSREPGGLGILGPADQTAEAADLVAEANQELQQVKVLFNENEGKRDEIKRALEDNDAANVKKISDEVVLLINEGFVHGDTAVEKIVQARGMNINETYREYLGLKEDALRKQMEAFDNYRRAAKMPRDTYDPQNAAARERVNAEFKNRNEEYANLMEEARQLSSEANELAKNALKKQQN